MAERDVPNLLNTLISEESSGGGFALPEFDYIVYTNTNSTTDTYVYKFGGSGGSTVATITIVYTDTSKNTISTVTKT